MCGDVCAVMVKLPARYAEEALARRAYAHMHISILNRGGRVWRRLRGVRTRIFSDGAAPAAGLHELARRAYAHI